jgi:ATP-binding cassette, subfamily F, member 2
MHKVSMPFGAFKEMQGLNYESCRRYGLLGPNGCGKSCLLKSLAAREVPIPEHIDIYHLDREAAASDETALDCVKSVDDERVRLDKEAEVLLEKEMCPEVEQRLEDIYERCVFQEE